ncbi:hypothetical protein IIA16_05410, partial [bacterium]|nr:hypothetical protein [bacterium]
MARKTKMVAGKGVGQEVRSFAAQKNASDIIPLSLIGHQLRSYENFRTEGIGQVLREVFPVNMEEAGIQLSIPEGEAFELEPPRIHNPNGGEETDPRKVLEQCRRLGRTWADSLRIRVQLYRHDTGEFKVQNLRIGNIPRMTDQATFLINGVEKVCVFQLIRSSGIFYRADGKDSLVASVKIIPSRGNWIEFTRDQKGKLYVRLGKTRKFHLA